MRRLGVLAFLIPVFVAAVGAPVATHAQQGPSPTPVTAPANPQPVGGTGSAQPQAVGAQITKDQLIAALLTQADVPELMQVSNTDFGAPASGVTLVARGFGRRQPFAEVVTELIASPGGSVDFALTSEQILRSGPRILGALSGAQSANFELLGPLGIGQQDSAALFETYLDSTGRWLVAYADYFQRGDVLGIVLYMADLDTADPSLIVTYARLQDSKIVAANI